MRQLKRKNPLYLESASGEKYTNPFFLFSRVDIPCQKKPLWQKFFVMYYLFGARYYDADIGLWISPDAARQFHSLYAYSPNPINSIDPDGNSCVSYVVLNKAELSCDSPEDALRNITISPRLREEHDVPPATIEDLLRETNAIEKLGDVMIPPSLGKATKSVVNTFSKPKARISSWINFLKSNKGKGLTTKKQSPLWKLYKATTAKIKQVSSKDLGKVENAVPKNLDNSLLNAVPGGLVDSDENE